MRVSRQINGRYSGFLTTTVLVGEDNHALNTQSEKHLSEDCPRDPA